VGNKSAVFPLQLLGFDVDIINSVQFSNHTGYPGGFKGTVLQGAELASLVEGLERNSLLSETTHLLTGYIGSESFLLAIVQVFEKLRAAVPMARYVCDPVLGDNGRLYVPVELVSLYKTHIIPLAYMVTPNSFECEKLTGIEVVDMASGKAACDALHAMGPTVVVITSMSCAAADKLTILASMKNGVKYAVDCPKVPGHYTGTGDLCAALLLAWDTLTPEDAVGGVERESSGGKLPAMLSHVVNTMYKVIRRTYEHKKDGELRLIQSKSDIEGGGAGGEDFVPYIVL
jgi:pyridoxine kinase